MIVELLTLLSGIALLAYCSRRGVDHAVKLASAFGVPTLVIGLVVVSIGTDLPEIINSILASAMGHGDINVGDSLGSCLVQISLILGLVGIVGGNFKVDRAEILEIGRCELMALLLAIFVSKTSYISRMDAALLIIGYALLVIAMRNYLLRNNQTGRVRTEKGTYAHLVMLFIYMAGVAVGSYMVINSIISLSKELLIPEYIISFFVLAIGTSLPELVVDITSVRRKEYALAIGDIIGSNVIDATLSIGIGPLIYPIAISGELATVTGVWTFIVSLIVIIAIGFMRKFNRKMGVLFITLYLLSYVVLFVA